MALSSNIIPKREESLESFAMRKEPKAVLAPEWQFPAPPKPLLQLYGRQFPIRKIEKGCSPLSTNSGSVTMVASESPKARQSKIYYNA